MKLGVALLTGIVLFLLVFTAGYLSGRGKSAAHLSSPVPAVQPESKRYYTCSMHPQVRLDREGICPICEMPLIPSDAVTPSNQGIVELKLSDHAIRMASIETVQVAYRDLTLDLRAVGKIRYDESSLATVTARVDGYAEKLFVNITGVDIRAGDHLADIYSPELLVAQKELFIALGSPGNSALSDTAKLKLIRWGMTEQQVAELIRTRKVRDRVTLFSPITGTVIEKKVVENDAFRTGDTLFRIANLETVWAYLEIYEFDLSFIRYGQKVKLTAEAYPGRVFEGVVSFVEALLNEETRTVRIPVHVENKDRMLKPGMFVSAVVKVALDEEARPAPTGAEGKFSCPMHPQVLKEKKGPCPVCGMPLEKIPGEVRERRTAGRGHEHASVERKKGYICPMRCEDGRIYDAPGNCPVCHMLLEDASFVLLDVPENKGLLAVPASSVLDSGMRKIVYVAKGDGIFEMRPVSIGPRSGEYYPVLKGLMADERVVSAGGFLIDSQFQITGHPSLYYPGGLHAAGENTAVEKEKPGKKSSFTPSTGDGAHDSKVGTHQH